MNFRRMPFQFTTTDPAERQRELEKRFGKPASRNMFVDVPNPLLMGSVPRESSATSSSPRLQHRVPIFMDGYDQPLHSSVDSTGLHPENKKPNVRVIPIEIEGAESKPARQQTFSGPVARFQDGSCGKSFADGNDGLSLKHSMENLTRPSKVRNIAGPKVHNIPIQIEASKDLVRNVTLEKAKKSPIKDPGVNGCTVTKPLKSLGKENKVKEVNKVKSENNLKSELESSLKKIENVLIELNNYEAEIQEFSGSVKDKKYRYLDEMLTRCMIKLDDIDTMGNENIRTVRKNAVKRVQAQIDLLESKAASSDIKNTTLGEISANKSDQQNEVVMERSSECESLEKEDGVMKDNNEATLYAELELENHLNKDIVSKLDGEMTEKKTDVMQMSDNWQSECDTEMTENTVDLPVVTMTGELETKANTEQSSDGNEVEMVEISDSSLVQPKDVTHGEIEEVEMAANDVSESNINSPSKDLVESKNKQVMKCDDVEMSDVQNFMGDSKQQVLEVAIENIASQSKENDFNKNLEDNVEDFVERPCAIINEHSQDEKCENIKTENEAFDSEINNIHNSLEKL